MAVYFIWGFSFLLSAIAQRVTTPFVLMAYRFDFAALLMTALYFLRRKKPTIHPKKIKKLLLLGFFEPCLYFIGEQYGIRYTNSAFSGIMIAVVPIVTLLFSSLILKKRASGIQWCYSFLSIAGIIVIVLTENSGGEVHGCGILFLAGAVITGSLFIVLSNLLSAEFSAWERSMAMQIMGAVFFSVLSLIENRDCPAMLLEPLMHPDSLGAILFLSIFSSALGYLLYNYAIANAPVATIAVMANLTTVISVLAGIFFLGDRFSPISGAAMIFVLAGIRGVQKNEPNPGQELQ